MHIKMALLHFSSKLINNYLSLGGEVHLLSLSHPASHWENSGKSFGSWLHPCKNSSRENTSLTQNYVLSSQFMFGKWHVLQKNIQKYHMLVYFKNGKGGSRVQICLWRITENQRNVQKWKWFIFNGWLFLSRLLSAVHFCLWT